MRIGPKTEKKNWALKNWCFWNVVLKKTLESPLDEKEIQLVHPKGNQSWIFFGRTNAETETPILCPHDKNWLIGKDPNAGKDWKRRRRDDRGWNGWMASPTQWIWVWVNSENWWWTGKPGMLQSMGLQRVGRDWETELNWRKILSLEFIELLGCGFRVFVKFRNFYPLFICIFFYLHLPPLGSPHICVLSCLNFSQVHWSWVHFFQSFFFFSVLFFMVLLLCFKIYLSSFLQWPIRCKFHPMHFLFQTFLWGLHAATHGILVPWLQIQPIPLHWKHGVLTSGPLGKSLPDTFLILRSLFEFLKSFHNSP